MTADAMPAVPEPPANVSRADGPRSCLLFVAHPDDDAIFAGALQRRATDAGATFTVVCLTHADGSPRAEELRAWQRRLGTDPARVHFLGFEDDPEDRRQGRCSIDASVALAAVRALGLRPDVVVTHNARGEYGHPHHLLVHRVARAAFPDAVRLEFGEGLDDVDLSVACGDKWGAVAATFASQRSVVATFARATETFAAVPREAGRAVAARWLGGEVVAPATAALDGFHPTVRAWFARTLGPPTPPQVRAWPAIATGGHVLVAAPTGSGKTLAAFLTAVDGLLRQGPALADATSVLYVSPLKALGNDVQKNLLAPLAALRSLDPSLPEVRVLVRTGDTPAKERAAMTKRPPHVLVTTPESLYLLLSTDGGRGLLATVRTVIVDEVHAVLGDKRGSHLALSLERLDRLAGGPQRIGLSATQKPPEDVARFLVGAGRPCAVVDVGHRRDLDLAVELPSSPLETVCSHEVWEELHGRIADLVRGHRTTLVFVNTRRLAERLGARLGELLGADAVRSHHGSLARERRLEAEQALKEGRLKALVATASLELGIDVGEVDLVVQVGMTPSIAVFLQRVGRSGHAVGRTPKGRLFPLTPDELVAAAALLRAVRRGELDRTPVPRAPLDILAQQVVAACVAEPWDEAALFDAVRRAWPYRDLARADFDATVALHTEGRLALLHRDGVGGRLRATRRARLAALLGGGAIPDVGEYRVLLEPEGTLVGTLNEDFAVEASRGDVFQLGNASWRILRIEPGVVRVADAAGAPASVPFWLGEGPGRTRELAAAVSALRARGDEPAWVVAESGVSEEAARQVAEYVAAGRKALGTVPTQGRLVLERFFDESGGMQLVLHAPFGSRVNRALGLALRKRFCRGFGFELQAAADDEAIVLSLGTQHAFDLADVFDYLQPETARDLLVQAVLPAPMFGARWRWNVARALLMARFDHGRRVPVPLQRMRAEDLLVKAFPSVLACPETLTGGDVEVPWEHPLVRQTLEDCLHEAMDVDGFLEVLDGLRSGRVERVALDLPEPSAFARGVLAAKPYAFLDDAPLEERRTQAVLARRVQPDRVSDTLGALDPEAVARVREEAWPDPRDAEEVHEALLWMGHVTDAEAGPWRPWLDALAAAGRVEHADGRWRAVEASRDPVVVLRGRMEALGPVEGDDPAFLALEAQGHVLRARLGGRDVWCDRRLLARIQRYTLDRLRRDIEPVPAATFLRFLAAWQHVDAAHRLEGPRGVAEVVRQLSGVEVPAAAWEAQVLPARVRDYRRDWLDALTLGGEVAWGRLWGEGASSLRAAPVALFPREDLPLWTGLAPSVAPAALDGPAAEVLAALRARGALFPQEIAAHARLLPSHVERALGDLAARGLVTCDAWAGLRGMWTPPSRRRHAVPVMGRWSCFRREGAPTEVTPELAETVALRLLARTGVVCRRTLLRERLPVPWRDVVRALRLLELRGGVRGGRFVAGIDGEQYALPEAVTRLRAARRDGPGAPVEVSAVDPLNYTGILVPGDRVPPQVRRRITVG
ncbi:MAG: DEAD/DEAH box helicase [Planctomycetota bacterium]